MSERAGSYLLAGQPTERDRRQLQSRVWEPAGRVLLAKLPSGAGLRALDVGCGVMGRLRVLSEWVGPHGNVVGADIDDKMLAGRRGERDPSSAANEERQGPGRRSVARKSPKNESSRGRQGRVRGHQGAEGAPGRQRPQDLAEAGRRFGRPDHHSGSGLPCVPGSLAGTREVTPPIFAHIIGT